VVGGTGINLIVILALFNQNGGTGFNLIVTFHSKNVVCLKLHFYVSYLMLSVAVY